MPCDFPHLPNPHLRHTLHVTAEAPMSKALTISTLASLALLMSISAVEAVRILLTFFDCGACN